MPRPKINKAQKQLLQIIEDEGGTVLSVYRATNHLRVDFTFDQRHVFTQTLPNSDHPDRRWQLNFRAQVRKTHRQLEN